MMLHVNGLVKHYLSDRRVARAYINYSGEEILDWYECDQRFTDWLLSIGEIILKTDKGTFWGRTASSRPIEEYEKEYRSTNTKHWY